MKTFLSIFLLTFCLTGTQQASASEHVILSGGPALRQWENLRVKKDRHDNWWANFIRAATLRMDKLRSADPNANLTWLVYRNGYAKRSREDSKPYLTWIQEQAKKRGAKLIWVSGSNSIISTINNRRNITTFDYFGHSNKHAFLLDYSSNVMGASSAWLHEKELYQIKSSVFSATAICKSWGCHSGESMNLFWKRTTGKELIGAHGKTDYSSLSKGQMPTINGSWVYKGNL